MKTVTLCDGKWNDIIFMLSQTLTIAEDNETQTIIRGLIMNILENMEDAEQPAPQSVPASTFGVPSNSRLINGYLVLNKYADCVTFDNCGSDFLTIIGFLAIFHPEYLDTFDYKDPRKTSRDGFWLKNNYRGPTGEARAPEFFHKFHIETVKTYPVSLLREMFERHET